MLFRSIGEKSIEALRTFSAPSQHAPDGRSYGEAIAAAGRGEVPGIAPRARSALAGVAAVVDRLRDRLATLDLPELLDAVFTETGLRAHLASEGPEGEERWQNLLELRGISSRFLELSPLDALDRFLEETALVADQDQIASGVERVTLITLHAAKGLEWPTVFISGLSEGLFPHSRAIVDHEQMEEERRLCYVGITRAKRRLVLSYAIRRGWGDGDGAPSRFLDEIPPELLEVDDAAAHGGGGETTFGRGRVRGFRTARTALGGGGAWRDGSGAAGTAADGSYAPTRDLSARRNAFAAGARSGSLAIPRGDDDGIDALPEDEVPTTIPIGRVPPWLAGRPRGGGSSDAATAAGIAPDVAATGPAPEVRTVAPARPRIPGERYYRDGDRVRHARFGDGIVVTSDRKSTRLNSSH